MAHNPNHKPFGSAKCPNPFPVNRSPSSLPPKRPPQELETASFDGISTLNLHECVLQSFLATNPHPELSGWLWPSLMAFLGQLMSSICGHPTKKGLSYGNAQERNGLRIAVTIVEDVDERLIRTVNARDLGTHSIFGFWIGKAYPLRFLASLIPMPDVLVPDFRMDIARSKISTPGGHWVHGPYLAIILYEKTTGLVVRARLWPIWAEIGLNRFALARSKPEIIGIRAANDAGGVVFSPTIEWQLAKLQEAFGHLWHGNLSSYPFLPDWLPMPIVGARPTISETFGMASLEHYAVGMKSKMRIGLECDKAGLFSFQYHVCGRGSPSALETEIREWVAQLYADPKNGLFKTTPA